MNKLIGNRMIIGSAIGIVLLVCLALLYRQSRRIGELAGEIASLRQGQDELAKRESALDAAAPKQLASALAVAATNPIFKGVVSFADASGRTAAIFDPKDGLVLLGPDNQRSVYISGQNGGVVHAGATINVGSFGIKDPPGVLLTANDAAGWVVLTNKEGPTIMLESDTAAGPTLLLGNSVDKENGPMVKILADDKESSIQVLPPDSQGKKRGAQMVSNAASSFMGIQKGGQMRGEIALSDSNTDEGAFAVFSNGNRSAALGEAGLNLVLDKQTILSLGLEKYGGELRLDSLSGERRIYASISEDSDGILGLFGPNGRSTVIGHASR